MIYINIYIYKQFDLSGDGGSDGDSRLIFHPSIQDRRHHHTQAFTSLELSTRQRLGSNYALFFDQQS